MADAKGAESRPLNSIASRHDTDERMSKFRRALITPQQEHRMFREEIGEAFLARFVT